MLTMSVTLAFASIPRFAIDHRITDNSMMDTQDREGIVSSHPVGKPGFHPTSEKAFKYVPRISCLMYTRSPTDLACTTIASVWMA
jgi:hypothetical protein